MKLLIIQFFFPLKVDYDLENCTSWVHIEKVLKFIQSYLDYMDSINQEAIQDAKKKLHFQTITTYYRIAYH